MVLRIGRTATRLMVPMGLRIGPTGIACMAPMARRIDHTATGSMVRTELPPGRTATALTSRARAGSRRRAEPTGTAHTAIDTPGTLSRWLPSTIPNPLGEELTDPKSSASSVTARDA